jgi:hypothetical protein
VNKNKGRVVAATVLASGAVWLAVSTSAFPAVAVGSASPPASIDLQTQAALQAKGARVLVPVAARCSGGAQALVGVRVNQRAGSVINAGYGESPIICNGSLQTIQVPVDASKPYKNGTAAATARLYPYSGGILEDYDVIQIKK